MRARRPRSRVGRLFPSLLLQEGMRVSMGIENYRVFGTESGRIGPLVRGTANPNAVFLGLFGTVGTCGERGPVLNYGQS